jgi:hypothetical protein
MDIEHKHHRVEDLDLAYVLEPVCEERHKGLVTTLINIKEARISDGAINDKNHDAQWKAIEALRVSVAELIRRIWLIIGIGTGINILGMIVLQIYLKGH